MKLLVQPGICPFPLLARILGSPSKITVRRHHGIPWGCQCRAVLSEEQQNKGCSFILSVDSVLAHMTDIRLGSSMGHTLMRVSNCVPDHISSWQILVLVGGAIPPALAFQPVGSVLD